MSTRITQTMVSRSVLADLTAANTRLSETQRKLASGRELTRPSDDPFATARAIRLRSELDGTRQHQRNAADAAAWSDVTDAALGNVSSIVLRARELVIAGATDTAGPAARAAAARELEGLIDSVKQEANASFAGRYVFAGAQTQTPPFAVGAGDAYAGDTASLAREIGRGVAVAVNVTGDRLLGPAPGGSGLLDALRAAASHLAGATPADAQALRNDDLRALDRAHDAVSRLQTGVGVTTNRIETAQARLGELEDSTVKLLSEAEDADMAKTMVDFSMQQAVYQSALKSGATIVQGSLLDFLR